MAPSTSPVFSKIDESFNPGDHSKYSCYVQVNDDSVTWCIFDNEQNRYVGIEIYRNKLQEIAEKFPLAHHPFRPVSVIVENNRSTLIPTMLFDQEEKDAYFDFIHEQKIGEYTRYDRMEQLEMVNVYAVPNELVETISGMFPGSGLFHHSTALIKSIWMNYKNRINGRKLFIHVRESAFDLLVFEGKQLEYYNAFHFKAPADIIYYVIFVMEQLDLNPEETGVILMGMIDRESPAYELLYRYIRNIEFAERNEILKYSYGFNEIPGHQHYLLLNLRLCAL
jgi:hypothetical protein